MFNRDKKKKAKIEFNGEFPCPYCFETIKQDEVCFLIKPETEFQIIPPGMLELLATDAREEYLARLEAVKPFLKRDSDEQLEQFWKDIGGDTYKSREYPEEYISWNSPIVTPETADKLTINGYEKDEDGFVVSVTDNNEKSKKLSTSRICPYCHNLLPQFYGKYPVKLISVVGISGAGKTVYLTQLISDLKKYLMEIGIDCFIKDRIADGFIKISSPDEILKAGTIPDILDPPASVIIKKGTEFYTLVFYDIAGKNCVDPQRMNRFGAFIQHSDGLIMLLDPQQFPTIGAQHNTLIYDSADVTTVLSTMKEAFLTEKINRETGKVDLPVAFVVSKSDYLVNELKANPKWKNSLITKEVETKNSKVNWGDVLRVGKDVKEIIREYAPDSYLVENIESNFGNKAFLAISSLGCDTRWVFTNVDYLRGKYILSEEAFKKADDIFIDLDEEQKRKLNNYVSDYALVPGEKTQYLKYSVKDGLQFDCPILSKDIYEQRDTIQFEIDPKAETIYEMIPDERTNEWKQGTKFIISKAPECVPKPKRVEEPLHWLLVKMHLAEYE